MSTQPDHGDPVGRLLRRTEVEHLTGLSRSTIYAHMAAGKFPPPLRIGPKTVRWSSVAIERWKRESIDRWSGKQPTG